MSDPGGARAPRYHGPEPEGAWVQKYWSASSPLAATPTVLVVVSSYLPAVVSLRTLPPFVALSRPFWRTREEEGRTRAQSRGTGGKRGVTRLDEGASAGKFALHFSRRTATPTWTLPRCKERAGSFVSPRFVCFAHYPSLRSSIFHYVRRLPGENN